MSKKNKKPMTLSWWARGIYGFVALNAFAGALILLLLPAHTETFFFWIIKPAINARLFGALYLGGAVAVALATWRNRWEPSRFLVPILVTAGVLISWVTLLHREAFAPGIRLVYWLAVYIGAPLLALLIYVAQERRGANWEAAIPVRPLTRRLAVITGGVVLMAGIVLILWPATAVAHWPWPTGLLMVRIFAAWFAAFGAGLLWFQIERDWRRLHHIPNLMIAAAGLDLLVVLIHRNQISGPPISLWIYCAHLIFFGLIGLLLHRLQHEHMTSETLHAKETALET